MCSAVPHHVLLQLLSWFCHSFSDKEKLVESPLLRGRVPLWLADEIVTHVHSRNCPVYRKPHETAWNSHGICWIFKKDQERSRNHMKLNKNLNRNLILLKASKAISDALGQPVATGHSASRLALLEILKAPQQSGSGCGSSRPPKFCRFEKLVSSSKVCSWCFSML